MVGAREVGAIGGGRDGALSFRQTRAVSTFIRHVSRVALLPLLI